MSPVLLQLPTTKTKSLCYIYILVGAIINNFLLTGVCAEGQIPLVRLPSNTLLKYSAYKDVSILHFRIPTETRTALFSFKAYEESKSAFRKFKLFIFNFFYFNCFLLITERECDARNVSLYLKAGSYPVISPENITFPRHFLDEDQR